MKFPSYFGPKLSGGANGSAGYTYQDVCALYVFFDYMNRGENVSGLGLEMINDFSIHLVDYTVTVQVKKTELSLKNMLKISESTSFHDKDTFVIVCTHLRKDLKQLSSTLEKYKNVISSELDQVWKSSITQNFNEELINRGLFEKKDLFLKSEIFELPEDLALMALYFVTLKWLEEKKVTVDIPNFMNSLLVYIQTLRGKRASLSLVELEKLVEIHSTSSIATEIIRTAYKSQFIEPSEIMSILGGTKEEIFDQLEKTIEHAQQHIENGEFQESLEIYLSLDKIYQKEELKFQCAILYETLNDYDNSLNYCNKILENNSFHYEANLVKGTSLGALKRYIDAIQQLEDTLVLRETPEVHYNLGYCYWLSEQPESEEKAIYHFKSCIELQEDFISAHHNLSLVYYQIGAYWNSLNHINKALQLDPESHKAYSHKGELYRFFGLYDDAIDYFEQCLARDKKNHQALLGISLCFAEKGFLSESAIHFISLLRYHPRSFFDEDIANCIGLKALFVDIGWKRTLYGMIEVENTDLVYIEVSGARLQLPLKNSKDYIFLGSIPLTDNTGTLLYPTVGKIMEKDTDFQRLISSIQENIQLTQFFDKPIYTNFENSIEINIEERDKYILIEILCNGLPQIVGITDQKTGGFEAFTDYFEQYGQCRIHLQCAENGKIFIIDCIEKVNIKPLN